MGSLEILQFAHEVLVGISWQAQVEEVLRDLALVIVIQVLENALEHIAGLVLEFTEQFTTVDLTFWFR